MFGDEKEQHTLFRVTAAMARALYMRVEENLGPDNELTGLTNETRLAKAFQLLGIGDLHIQVSQHNGYTIEASQAQITQIQEICAACSRTIHLSQPMAKSLYQEVQRLSQIHDSGISPDVYRHMNDDLRNHPNCDKILEALRLLGITNIQDATRGEQIAAVANFIGHNQHNGYVLQATPDIIDQIETIHDAHHIITFHLKPDMARPIYEAATARYGEDSTEIRHMNSLNNQRTPAKLQEALRLLGITFNEVTFHDGGVNGYGVCANRANVARLNAILTPELRVDTGPATCAITTLPAFQSASFMVTAAAAATNTAPAAQTAAQRSVDVVYRVQQDNQTPRMPDTDIRIIAPDWVQAELQRISPMLQGVRINLPDGTVRVIEGELTLRDLQLLARNESFNTTGDIALNQYHNIDHRLILTLKDLVRHCVVVGRTEITAHGGYGNTPLVQLLPHTQEIILCDLAGLQFQQPHNSGRLVLIGDNIPQGICDTEIFRQVVGEDKATLDQCRADTTGRYIPVGQTYFDREAYIRFVAEDVVLAARAMCQIAQPGEQLNFKFLKYGCRSFAGNYAQQVNAHIAAGVLRGLEMFFARYDRCSHIECIELPFYGQIPHEVQSQITALCDQYGKQVYFGDNDALQPRADYTTATTNCGDPHAVAGNEMRYGSVDTAIGENCLNKCNEFSSMLNPVMTCEYVAPEAAVVYHQLPSDYRCPAEPASVRAAIGMYSCLFINPHPTEPEFAYVELSAADGLVLSFRNQAYIDRLHALLMAGGFQSVNATHQDRDITGPGGGHYVGSVQIRDLREVNRFIRESLGRGEGYVRDLCEVSNVDYELLAPPTPVVPGPVVHAPGVPGPVAPDLVTAPPTALVTSLQPVVLPQDRTLTAMRILYKKIFLWTEAWRNSGRTVWWSRGRGAQADAIYDACPNIGQIPNVVVPRIAIPDTCTTDTAILDFLLNANNGALKRAIEATGIARVGKTLSPNQMLIAYRQELQDATAVHDYVPGF